MEERKQTKNWSYSTSGKVFRGLLCMLTFCACMAGAAVSAYTIYQFGTDILYHPQIGYENTQSFQDDFQNDLTALLYNVNTLYQSGEEQQLTIINVEEGMINRYDLEEMGQDFRHGKITCDISEYDNYEISKERFPNAGISSMSDYNKAIQYLKSIANENTYLYVTPDAFNQLFKATGAKNDNKRFLENFSSSSYFLFDYSNNDDLHYGEDQNLVLQELTSLEMRNAQENTINEEQTFNAALDGDSTEVQVNIITDSEETDSLIGDMLENKELNYAVYDSENNLYYSTWDDYFTPMSSYIYNVQELLAEIEGRGITKEDINSLVLPMLWSYNYSSDELWSNIQADYQQFRTANERMSKLQDSGFVYYVRCNGKSYMNVSHLSDITSLPEVYWLCGEESPVTKVAGAVDIKKQNGYDMVQNTSFSSLPEDSFLYVGIDTSRITSDDTSKVINGMWQYDTFGRNIRFLLAGTVVLFILLMVQAVWLIRTTGRREKGGKELVLNRYDKLPTELWGAIYIGILALGTVAGWQIAEMLFYRLEGNMEFLMCVVFLLLPLGFAFMELTLSAARRVKAHNFWNTSLLRKLWSRFHKKSKGFFQNKTGTQKFFVVFVGYVVIEVLIVLVLISDNFFNLSVMLLFFVFLALQVVAAIKIYHVIQDIQRLTSGVVEITEGNLDSKVTVIKSSGLFAELVDGINHIGDGLKKAVETSLKDERMKTELITNVSHDLKTPLTSIINYINLLKTEKMPTPEAEHYVEVLDGKAQRLKQLTEDLVEAAKATSGNIELEMMPLAFSELMKQALGEFEDKFAQKELTLVTGYPEEETIILADGRRMFRIIENILQNAYKYALPGTRIYADLSKEQSMITFVLKNISAAPLNISSDELMERFTRGDSARSTEGSGLGLSIAKDLTRLQGGTFDIALDGDLFKVIITFPEYT